MFLELWAMSPAEWRHKPIIILLKFRKFAPYALKGQKLLAQGSALGFNGRYPRRPVRAKAFKAPSIYKAFSLTGRIATCYIYPGRCPGLGASALSGRMADCDVYPGRMAPRSFWNFSPFPSHLRKIYYSVIALPSLSRTVQLEPICQLVGR